MIKGNGILYKVTDKDLKLLKRNPEEFWKGVEEIGFNAFEYCQSLKEIEIPSTVKNIDSIAFASCRKLEKLVLHEGLEKIEGCAFEYCSSLKEIEIPSTVKKVEYDTFTNCFKLEKVTLHEGLEEIGESAFLNCDSLKEVVIPSTVKEIAPNAFPPHVKVIRLEKKEEKKVEREISDERIEEISMSVESIKNVLNIKDQLLKEKDKANNIKR